MINDELERMRDANRGRRESPEQRMASLTGEQPSVASSPNPRGTGATRSPEERMAGISPQPAPEIPAPAPDPEPPPTDDIAALKMELSNAMTALQGLMMAANDALNKAHEARDLYDDDFPEWPSDGGGIDVLRVLSFSCSVVVDENDQDKQKIKVEKGWFVDAKEYGEFAGELVEVPDLDGHYWLYVLATKAEDPEEDDPQWDIAVESTDEPESEFEEYELTDSDEKVVRVLCHVKRDGDDLEIVWRNHEGDVSRGGEAANGWNGKTQYGNDDGTPYDIEVLLTPTETITAAHGQYLMGDLFDGSSELTDDPGSYDAGRWHKWHVADRSGSGTSEDPYIYTLSPDTVGTIHIGKR